jgi:hypothetical protein
MDGLSFFQAPYRLCSDASYKILEIPSFWAIILAVGRILLGNNNPIFNIAGDDRLIAKDSQRNIA